MLLMIDNYDSFTYNLVQYFGELGAELGLGRDDSSIPESFSFYDQVLDTAEAAQ